MRLKKSGSYGCKGNLRLSLRINKFGTDAGSGRIIMAIALGLLLVGLAGYAVNSLLTYRRENDL